MVRLSKTFRQVLATAALLAYATAGRAEPPVVAWLGPQGLVATRIGTSEIRGTQLAATWIDPGMSHALILRPSHGSPLKTPNLPVCVAAEGDRIWVDYFVEGFAGGGPRFSRVTSRCSLGEFAKGRIAAAPDPARPSAPPRDSPLSLRDQAWSRTDSETDAVRVRRESGRYELAGLVATGLVPSGSSECLRFDLTRAVDQVGGILLCTHLVKPPRDLADKGSPPFAGPRDGNPMAEVQGQVAVPFAEAFAVMAVGQGYHFVTASGRLFATARDAAGVPRDFREVNPGKGGRVVGVMTDTGTKKIYIFTQPSVGNLRLQAIDDDAAPVEIKAVVTSENFADTLGAAEAMYAILVGRKLVKPVEQGKLKS